MARELAHEIAARDPHRQAHALPFDRMTGTEPAAALPAWYMPAPMSGLRVLGWRRGVVLTFVSALLVIEAYGLCTTFGPGF